MAEVWRVVAFPRLLTQDVLPAATDDTAQGLRVHVDRLTREWPAHDVFVFPPYPGARMTVEEFRQMSQERS